MPQARQRTRLEKLRTEVVKLQELQQQELALLQMQMNSKAQVGAAAVGGALLCAAAAALLCACGGRCSLGWLPCRARGSHCRWRWMRSAAQVEEDCCCPRYHSLTLSGCLGGCAGL